MTYDFCPKCGCAWNPWAVKSDPVKCWACGFVKPSENGEVLAESVPESCSDHPKYRGLGEPKSDCPTCWMIYKSAVCKKADEIIKK